MAGWRIALARRLVRGIAGWRVVGPKPLAFDVDVDGSAQSAWDAMAATADARRAARDARISPVHAKTVAGIRAAVRASYPIVPLRDSNGPGVLVPFL